MVKIIEYCLVFLRYNIGSVAVLGLSVTSGTELEYALVVLIVFYDIAKFILQIFILDSATCATVSAKNG